MGVLGSHDFCGATFYIACNMMLAFSIFFFSERQYVPKQWGSSVTISGIVTFIAWYNYTYMKSVWVWTQESPTVYRYTDKLATCGAKQAFESVRSIVTIGWLIYPLGY